MRSRSKDNQGSILVLTAILAVGVLALIGLLIDTALWSSSKTGHEHITEFAATAALDGFVQAGAGGTAIIPMINRLTQAASQAEEATGINFDSFLGRNISLDPTDRSNAIGIQGSGGSGQNGIVIPGVWHFEEPQGGCAGDLAAGIPAYSAPAGVSGTERCPCGNGGWAGACFQPYSSIPADDANVNAIKVVLNTSPNASLKTFFSQAFSRTSSSPTPDPRLALQSESIATLIPRRGVFLVDLSPSITEDTHEGLEPNFVENYGLYSYQAIEGRTCRDSSMGGTPSPMLAGRGSPEWNARISPGGDLDFLYFVEYGFTCIEPAWSGSTWGSTCASQPLISVDYNTTPNPPRHSQLSYRCTGGLPNGRSSGDNVNPTFEFLADEGMAPQPLSAVLGGVNAAMSVFLSRSVPADLFGFIGFDDDIGPIDKNSPQWNGALHNRVFARSTTLAGDPDVMSMVIPRRITGEDFDEFFQATDLYTNGSPDLTKITNKYRRMLLPKSKTNRPDLQGRGPVKENSRTDLPNALRAALEMLARAPSSDGSESFVVLFTDGLTECASHPFFPDSCNISTRAGIDWFYNAISLIESLNIAFNEYSPQKVSLNVFLTGRDVAPHTQALKGSNGCLSDQEARALFYPSGLTNLPRSYTSPNNFISAFPPGGFGNPNYLSKSPVNPWTFPNVLYYAAVATDGIWAPLRPACPGGRGAAGYNSPFENELNSACNGAAGSIGTPITNGDLAGHNLLTQPVQLNGVQVYNQAVQSGRVLCDPQARNADQQVSDAIDQIMGKNPYLLVAEDPGYVH